eukprot:CAMPEP_0178926168 /NCGR_PEP_ID=MMETSP0786-20121207/18361_1 /TAXON_ID=186022 /ORGANISM="Thalassionema frauenfeldii, Strain CCMP 1798" /LENGTH=345 /DNA_ID=CAMNT_0020601217 /DNA_START=284 /DNA_END=1318 /DNA_ORIENTATION=-
MSHWIPVAEQYRFILVIPEGVGRPLSFNAPLSSCCGDAREMQVDDVGFLQGIITELSSSTFIIDDSNVNATIPKISRDLVYGMGWSNGGYMVMAAAKLFRAIAPISGFQVGDELLPSKEKPTGLFMHHADDDRNVRITGCCDDINMPQCCCSLSQNEEACISASQKFETFGNLVNGCSNGGTDDIVITHDYGDGNIVHCTSLSNCKANTTFCRHNRGGHFNKPSFDTGFTMSSSIADFFANDACTASGGQWTNEACACLSSSTTGTYCSITRQEAKEKVSSELKVNASSHAIPPDAALGSTMKVSLLLLCICTLMIAFRLYYKSRLRYTGFQKVSTGATVELRKI